MNEKMKIIIVDDEDLVRERFRYGFPLEDYGYEIIGEAEDGEEALQLCKQTNPDIVITDIVMPGMDGLELTQKLIETMPHVKVIILSCHDQFEFAQKALSIGAFDYLLKVTTGFQQLLAVLERARAEVENSRVNMMEKVKLKYQLEKSIFLLRKQFIQDLIDGACVKEQNMQNQCDLLGMHMPEPCFSIACFKIDRLEKIKRNYTRDFNITKYGLMKIIEEISNKTLTADAFLWEENYVMLWIHWENEINIPDERETLALLLNEINNNIQRNLSFTVSMGVSNIRYIKNFSHLRECLSKAIYEAVEALHESFYTGYASINLYRDIKKHMFLPLAKYEREALFNRLSGINAFAEEEHMEKAINKLVIHDLIKKHFYPPDVLEWLEQITLNRSYGGPNENDCFDRMHKEVETVSDVTDYLMYLLGKTKQALYRQSMHKQYHESVQKALDYIFVHYNEPLSVSIVCGHINISPNYFSHIFKAETGMNFTDYVTRFRIEQAKRLLSETSLKIQEIAEQTGIPDYKYFTKLFRRITGYTPSSYRCKEGESVS